MSAHYQLEQSLRDIEASLADAKYALSDLPESSDDLESDLGTAVDELREVYVMLDNIGTTDLEDVEDACSSAASTLDNIITTLHDHYNRL